MTSYTPQTLATAELHVAQAERHVAEQEQRLSELRERSEDTEAAETLLAGFQDSLQMHREDRDRIAETLVQAEKKREKGPVGVNGFIPPN